MPPLEPSPEALRTLIDAATERILNHLEALDGADATNTTLEGGTALARSIAEPRPPEEGRPLDDLLELLFDRALAMGYLAAGPGYLAYIPGGGVPAAGVASLIADTVNRYVGIWTAAPGAVQIEVDVVRWLCHIVGYPETSFGFLTTGGSLATLSGVVTARSERLPEDFLAGTIYVCAQAHHSVAKAAMLAGFPRRNLRIVPHTDDFRMDVPALRAALDADPNAFLVVAAAGTTNTGAVDDLPALADLCRSRGLWLHVDAAYGGFFALTERGRQTLQGLERADSITLDPHKGLFLPYGTGALLVRDRDALHRTHHVDAEYLPPPQDSWERVDWSAITPELSRDFRGLRVWLPIALYGLSAFREQLDEKLDLIAYATERLRRLPGVEIVSEPQLTVTTFRLIPRTGEDADALNRALLERINAPKRVFLTGTRLNKLFVIRICVLCFRTHRPRVDAALEDIQAAIAAIRS